ncbi:cytochrome c oxidase assembly protein [Aquihabitans sp. McL0605]|uniref:cytochrome c oxidase assembly protein n=1 Tax=Aquihabitans sp. McL0605 TaxID=3415671 RepID=UPI003CF8D541
MSWWCSSSLRNWTWTPKPYAGAWAIVLGVLAIAAWWHWRGQYQEVELDAREAAALGKGSGAYPSSSTTRTVAFVFGLLGLWACLDWPLATLGAGYLASAQMVRQVLMVFAVAPLLLFSCPAPLAVRLFGWGRRFTVLRWSARPIVAIPVASVTLLLVNAPAVLDPMVSTPYGAFGLDFMWILAGFVLWMPVQCPHPGVPRLTGAVALAYLIIQSIVPVLPGFFMTWADFPIYRTYDLAPRAIAGFDAVSDQQTAAAILQVGGMVVLWLQISFRFLHWGYEQMALDRQPRKPIQEVSSSTP